jgi:pyruvate kinase
LYVSDLKRYGYPGACPEVGKLSSFPLGLRAAMFRLRLSSSILRGILPITRGPSVPLQSATFLTKVIATLGPATSSKEVLEQLVDAGADIFRLNFSHGNTQDHQKLIDLVKEIRNDRQIPLPILGDLQGPKIRVGDVQGGSMPLVEQEELSLVAEVSECRSGRISTPFRRIISALQVGHPILLDDGALRLTVVSRVSDTEVKVRVDSGGTLKSKKGLNTPLTQIDVPALTEADKRNVVFAVENELDVRI